MYKWFCSYLANRSQYTYVNGSTSDLNNISYGVPQGSVLGPLLFLIYINDLGLFDKINVKPKLFADDTNSCVYGNGISELTSKCQNVIDKISMWTSANRLSLNNDKTFYMVFLPSFSQETSPDLNLFINSLPIKKENSFKFLGVTIDERLKWKPHIQDIVYSITFIIGIFYKLSIKLPPKVLKCFTLQWSTHTFYMALRSMPTTMHPTYMIL